MNIADLNEVTRIFMKYGYDDVMVSAEHDQIFFSVTDNDIPAMEELEKMGVHYDTNIGCWYCFV